MSGKAVRETLAALGVIASLVFVGMEIRQTNQIARQESLRHISDTWLAANVALLTDERLSELQERLVTGEREADFAPADRQSLHMLFFTLNHVYQTRYREVELGLLSPDDVYFPETDNTFWNSDFHRDVWRYNRSEFSEGFTAFWEDRFNLMPGATSG